MKDDPESLKTQLRQVDDYERKGLMRPEEAAAQRTALQKRLLQVLLPAAPAPRLPWRTRLWALGAMVVLVGAVSAYLVSGHAGLRRRSEELLDAGKAAAAADAAAARARAADPRSAKSRAPDARGVFPDEAAASVGDTAIAPLLSGRVHLAPALADRAATGDALFIVVRLPDDPDGLPLAAIRKQVGDLPLEFRVGSREVVGDTTRFMQAGAVVVTARVSKSGSGRAQPGDLIGVAPAAPWRAGIDVTIDQVVPQP